ncbi:hypothetical protein PoHVEF18_001493 [Penicillium ochrochloron]
MSAPVLPSPIDPAFISRLDDDFIEYYNKNLAIKPATHNITIEHIRAAPEKFASPWYRDFTYEPFVKDIRLKAEDGHEFTAVENGKELNGRPDSISIGGISAGGHISAVCQQLARDAKIDLKLATYKGDDINEPSDSPYPSVSENENAPCLNWKRLKFFRSLYDAKTDAERAEITARPICFRSPLDGNLNGVCRTYVATADCDPLRDEGEDYARKLNENGVQVTVRRYTGVPHPFMHMLVVKKAQMYMDDICAHLRMAHGA